MLNFIQQCKIEHVIISRGQRLPLPPSLCVDALIDITERTIAFRVRYAGSDERAEVENAAVLALAKKAIGELKKLSALRKDRSMGRSFCFCGSHARRTAGGRQRITGLGGSFLGRLPLSLRLCLRPAERQAVPHARRAGHAAARYIPARIAGARCGRRVGVGGIGSPARTCVVRAASPSPVR
jgi:hypothetical protein